MRLTARRYAELFDADKRPVCVACLPYQSRLQENYADEYQDDDGTAVGPTDESS